MSNLKVGDRVKWVFDEKHTGTITHIIEDTAIVKYDDGTKHKDPVTSLVKVDDVKMITAVQFDEAVKALMYEAAEDVGDTDQLDGVLEIIGTICRQLKTRLFEGND